MARAASRSQSDVGPTTAASLAPVRASRMLGGIAAVGGLYLAVLRDRHLNWHATAEEGGPLPGDELLPDAAVVSTRVVEIDAPPAAVWPWLVQMGPGRGGAYTYDWLERRLGVPIENTNRIVPEL